MSFVRTIFILVISLSVATLPAAAGFSANAPASKSASSMIMPDCGHQIRMPAEETQKTDIDCISISGCVFHCFSFTGVSAANVGFVPAVGATLRPMRKSDRLFSQTGSLPFRPPRI